MNTVPHRLIGHDLITGCNYTSQTNGHDLNTGCDEPCTLQTDGHNLNIGFGELCASQTGQHDPYLFYANKQHRFLSFCYVVWGNHLGKATN